MPLNLGMCPITGESICFCGLDEDDPAREPVTKIFEADDEGGSITGRTFEYSFEGLTSTIENDGFVLSDGNRDEVEFAGGDDVIQDFSLGEDALTVTLPGLDWVEQDISTAEDFIGLVGAASFVEFGGSSATSTVEAYICEHGEEPADLVLVVRNAEGVAQHSVKLIGLADEIGVEELQAAGATVESHQEGEAGHDHSDEGPMIIEDNNAFLMAMGEGSRIEIHAADADKMSFTTLATQANRNQNSITVEDTTGWEVGDRIAITSTDRWSQQHEEFTIQAINGRTITLDGQLEFQHMAETRHYDNGLTGADHNTWEVDMRANVALLSRNVTIQGDADSVQDGFGAHTMVMHGAMQHIDGAEFTRVGQEDILGRYPIHWHLNGDSEGQFVTNSSIHHSYQKGATIHGTSNLLFENNVIFDHIGHGVFLEDGAETGNQILGNIVFGTKASESGLPIPTDRDEPTSYWIENPENILIGNIAGGSEGNGFWIFQHDEVHGLSADLFPGQTGDFTELIFRDNTAYSTQLFATSVGARVNPETLEVQAGGGELVTPDAGFATIEGYTAWNIGLQGVWTSAQNVVIRDSAVVNTYSGYRPLFETHIVDSMVAEAMIGLRVYWSGGSSANNVHLVDNDYDIQAFTNSRFSTPVGVQNVTSDGTINIEHVFDAPGKPQPAAVDEVNASHVFLDIDGSVTGIRGATFTPGTATSNEFRTAPDAVFNPVLGAWVTEATIASTYLYMENRDRNVDLILVRDDGLSEDGLELANRELFAEDTRLHYKVPAAAGLERDVAYLLDYDDVPEDLTVDLRFARNGDSVLYEIANVADFGSISGAAQVGSLNALVAAGNSAYFHNGSSLFLKLVARFDGSLPEKSVDDLAAAYRASDLIDIEGIVDGNSAGRHGNRSVSQDLIEAIENGPMNDPAPLPFVRQPTIDPVGQDFVLQRYESTSDTYDATGDMARWSESATWGGTLPRASSIVVIGEGQTVVLDQSATVRGIIIDGGNLIVEDAPGGPQNAMMLIADYVLVINGGLFQAGTESDPLDRDFTLELTGDDPDFDLHVTRILNGEAANTDFSQVVPEVPEVPVTPVQGTAPGTVSGRVFADVDGSGGYTEGEGAEGVTVELRQSGEIVASRTTDDNGWYRFDAVPLGTGYSVRFLKSENLEFVESEGQTIGSADNLNSTVFEVTSGAQIPQINGTLRVSDDAPEAQDDRFDVRGNAPSVLDVVANDADDNTARSELEIVDVSDPDAGSVEIVDDTIHFTPDYTAYRTESGLIAEKAEESFTYRVADGAGNTAEATVVLALSFDPGIVNGWLFADGDNDGAFDGSADSGAGGYEVQLRFNDETFATTTTLPGGFYQFEDVPAGSGYTVRFIDQEGTEFVPNPGQIVGSANNLNTAGFEVAPGTTVRQVNGIVQQTVIEDPARLELGSLEISQDARGLWTRVDFETPIPDAVVVVGPLSYNGVHEATVRVRNVDETGFELQIDEWSYHTGWHMEETVSWMAASEGKHKLPDGTIIQAGRTIAENETNTQVAFDAPFEEAPIVFTQVASDNGLDPVTTRNQDVTEGGFSVRMQEEEAKANQHLPEQVDWIAVEKSDGILDVGTEIVDHNFKSLDLQGEEVFLADMQTMYGGNTATLRYEEAQDGSLRIKVDEELSLDQEEWHREEEVGFLATQEGSHSLLDYDAA
ncbi:MAG: SdrD B-like domain-containing protein [Pseudomonadota bacterium]